MQNRQNFSDGLLRDRKDIDPDALGQLLEYYGDDVTVDEIAASKHGAIVQYANQCRGSELLARELIGRARRR